jgi:hypothetical protein
VTLARDNGRLTCTVVEGFARENGKGITVNSPMDGAQVRILSAKQSASTCRVVERR